MKKNLTKINAIMLILTIFIGMIPMGVMADTEGYYSYDIIDSTAIITGYTGYEVCIIIPSELGGYPVKGIGLEAFAYCGSLKNITIPDSVTSIWDFAFFYCTNLESITIPDSITTIGDYVFFCCRKLESITISDSITSISDGAFIDCTSLESITIPDSVTSIGESAFYNCISLKSITIPDSAKSIGRGAFFNCISLESITIPNSVTSIGDLAFYYRSNDLVIHCYETSYAHNYAIEKGIKFTLIPVEVLEILYGDVTGDGAINIQDTIAIFRHLADKDIIPDDSEQFDRADVNNDEEITIQDAIVIFRYLADKITFEELQARN